MSITRWARVAAKAAGQRRTCRPPEPIIPTEYRRMDDNMNASAPQADDAELLTAMGMKLSALKLENPSPESVVAAIKSGAWREVCGRLVKSLPRNASKEKVFSCLLRISQWSPELFSRPMPALKSMTGPEKLHFASSGETPFRPRRSVK